MGAALGWGSLSAFSLVLGALLALARRWPERAVGSVLAFGAGALISAVSFELAQEGIRVGDRGSTAAGLAAGEGVSVGLLVAIFVSNLPEAAGSASEMRTAGRDDRTILRLWLAVATVCALASGVGFALADAVSDNLKAVIDGFAAGALLVMLVDSMIPDARRAAGRPAGLVTVLGFAVAAGLSFTS